MNKKYIGKLSVKIITREFDYSFLKEKKLKYFLIRKIHTAKLSIFIIVATKMLLSRFI